MIDAGEFNRSVKRYQEFNSPGAPFTLDRKITVNNLENNLAKIVELIKSAKAIPVLQTYVSDYELNSIIADFSIKYNVALIDNSKSFKGLSGAEDFFVFDGHPNEKGYHIIAENAVTMLKAVIDSNNDRQGKDNYEQ